MVALELCQSKMQPKNNGVVEVGNGGDNSVNESVPNNKIAMLTVVVPEH